MEIHEFKKQFDELVAQNDKLEHLKKRYIEHAAKLGEIIATVEASLEDMKKLQNAIDPVVNYTPRAKNSSKKEIIAELYQKMIEGTQVGRSLVMSSYGVSDKEANYILESIKKLPKVEKRREAKNVILFMTQ